MEAKTTRLVSKVNAFHFDVKQSNKNHAAIHHKSSSMASIMHLVHYQQQSNSQGSKGAGHRGHLSQSALALDTKAAKLMPQSSSIAPNSTRSKQSAGNLNNLYFTGLVLKSNGDNLTLLKNQSPRDTQGPRREEWLYYLSSAEMAFRKPFQTDSSSQMFREHFVQTCQGILYANIATPFDARDIESKSVCLGERSAKCTQATAAYRFLIPFGLRRGAAAWQPHSESDSAPPPSMWLSRLCSTVGESSSAWRDTANSN